MIKLKAAYTFQDLIGGNSYFYYCPLDLAHLWTALRYVELNPVRAGLVESAAQWRWSSAIAHAGAASAHTWLDLDSWHQSWTVAAWGRAGPPLHHHERGCLTLRDFRRVSTTDLDAAVLRHIQRM